MVLGRFVGEIQFAGWPMPLQFRSLNKSRVCLKGCWKYLTTTLWSFWYLLYLANLT